MKTLSIALTCVFVTLKLTDHIDWPWFWVVCPFVFWCALALLLAFAYGVAKAWKRIEEQEREKEKVENRSKWQQRLDEIRAAREKGNVDEQVRLMNEHINDVSKNWNNKTTVIIILLMCATIYSCRPAHNVTACPKPFYGKFNK